MPGLRVRLFGSACLEAGGAPDKLKPITAAVLVRLIVADGASVAVDEIYRDAWRPGGLIPRDYRTQVHKRIHEIRRLIDRAPSGEMSGESPVLSTERGSFTSYRLRIPRGAVDVFRFIDLVTEGRTAAPADQVGLLERALALWGDEPLRDVADQPWAAPTVRLLHELRHAAMLDLRDAYARAGRYADALGMAEKTAGERPSDTVITASLAALREQVRAAGRKPLVREEFTDPDVVVIVQAGDLFAQDDANIVVGFTDTFDTDTDRNIVIAAESAQGMLLERLYGGDRQRLDRELRSALSRVPRNSVERKADKPRGKLTRYPLGTVVSLPYGNRCVFAVAYSRMSNDLVAQSSVPELRASLENLWAAVHRRGLLKPVAMPLAGSSLSRIHTSHDELLQLIVGSFLERSRQQYICPELRIVVQQPVFDKLRVAEVLKAAREETFRSV